MVLFANAHNDTTITKLSPRSLSWSTSNPSDNYSLSADECCVCWNGPFETFNESEFQRIFKFNCAHSSKSVCIKCWKDLYILHGNDTRCPLCRATNPYHEPVRSPDNAPFGDDITASGPYSLQPGYLYVDLSLWGQIRHWIDIENGCVGLWCMENYDVVKYICCSLRIALCLPTNHTSADRALCVLGCPGAVGCVLCFCVMDLTQLAGSLAVSGCCCCDCCHVCAPCFGWRGACIRAWAIRIPRTNEFCDFRIDRFRNSRYSA